MPWLPELFSEPVRVRFLEERRRREELETVPCFAGFLTGEIGALIGSFAGEPEVHYPVRGRVKGERAFAAYAKRTRAWLEEREASIEDVGIVANERRSVGEAVLRLGGEEGRVELPVAIVADRRPDDRIEEVRVYYSNWYLAGRHSHRPPVLQPDPELRGPDAIGVYQRAFAAGDIDAIAASFDSDGYAREPADGDHIYRGTEDLRRFYGYVFSNGGGVAVEHCSVTDDGRACAVEYNLVRWGQTEVPPEAGVAVYVRGGRGKLAAARIYDDADPPLAAPA